jgi:hypothetical protein
MAGAAGFFIGGVGGGPFEEEAKMAENQVVILPPLPVDVQIGVAVKRLCPFAEPVRPLKRFKANPQE